MVVPEGLLLTGFPFWNFHTSTTEPRMTKISRFARNDDTGVCYFLVS